MNRNLKFFLSKIWNNFFIFLLIFILIALKTPWLTLPFYWDEAWSYAMAIFDMANHGPTLIPGHANEWFTRGHPLFFYFISSLWLTVFGKTLLSAHLFALLISCFSLYIIHFCSKKLFSTKTANIVALSVMAQIIFIAQSTLLLPEIFLMGLSAWVFYLYLQKKWIAFIAVSFCLILSKETALVLFFALLLDTVILQKLVYRKERQYNITFYKELVFVTIPFLFFAIFLGIQKLNLGYFFFPEHTGLMTLGFKECIDKMASISNLLFMHHSRWIWLCFVIVAVILAIVKKRYLKKDIHIFLLSTVFIFGYILFSSLNFFTPRYILTILPFLFMIYIPHIIKYIPSKTGAFLIGIAIGCNLYYSFFSSNGEMDFKRTFNQSIIAHKEAVNFCESQNWQDKTINTGFLMSFNLQYPQLGYLNNVDKPFSQCENYEFPEIFIFYSSEINSRRDEIKENPDYILAKRIEKSNGCYVEIYKKESE